MTSHRGVCCIVVAAGMSTRFPGNKLLYRVKNKPLILYTLENLVESNVIDRIVLVLGYQAAEVFRVIVNELSNVSKILFVYNKEYKEGGMSSSIKTGLKACPKDNDIMVHPGDVPFVKPEVIRSVVEEHLKSNNLITIASYKGRGGHPIIISRELRRELESIREETMGLKDVVKRYADKVVKIETGTPSVLRDIDSMEDLEEAEKMGIL